ncbi:hypothetical protein DVA86_20445 [Streptomyces armeniacus]|uniref:Uncharacterized protein n=1 Tax=Streptomyces armeniacus TaxID=83291 RepID=A0A345XSP9_9ACTN|nr:hypothetical protein DVA86_20445 [Streptomyces armeniacus]
MDGAGRRPVDAVLWLSRCRVCSGWARVRSPWGVPTGPQALHWTRYERWPVQLDWGLRGLPEGSVGCSHTVPSECSGSIAMLIRAMGGVSCSELEIGWGWCWLASCGRGSGWSAL